MASDHNNEKSEEKAQQQKFDPKLTALGDTAFFMAEGRARESAKDAQKRLYFDPFATHFSGDYGLDRFKSMVCLKCSNLFL